ncbi:MAG: hypothetical protein ACM3KR_04855 [Deltaproteobacteria bacterium]
MEGPFWEYRYLFVLGLLIFIFYQFEWQRSRAILYALMLKAKRAYIKKVFLTGKEQEDWVVKRAMQILPVSVRVFLSNNILRSIIHEMYQTLDTFSIDEEQEGFSSGNKA